MLGHSQTSSFSQGSSIEIANVDSRRMRFAQNQRATVPLGGVYVKSSERSSGRVVWTTIFRGLCEQRDGTRAKGVVADTGGRDLAREAPRALRRRRPFEHRLPAAASEPGDIAPFISFEARRFEICTRQSTEISHASAGAVPRGMEGSSVHARSLVTCMELKYHEDLISRLGIVTLYTDGQNKEQSSTVTQTQTLPVMKVAASPVEVRPYERCAAVMIN